MLIPADHILVALETVAMGLQTAQSDLCCIGDGFHGYDSVVGYKTLEEFTDVLYKITLSCYYKTAGLGLMYI